MVNSSPFSTTIQRFNLFLKNLYKVLAKKMNGLFMIANNIKYRH